VASRVVDATIIGEHVFASVDIGKNISKASSPEQLV
jgi:hypothetical protein